MTSDAPRVLSVYPHQQRLLNSRSFVSAIIGGIGSGKSYALGFCVLHWMQTESPLSPIVACAPTYQQLDQATISNLKKLLSECDIDYIHGSMPPTEWQVPLAKAYRKWTNIITLETGHIIICVSLDEPSNLRGPQFGMALMDELAFCPDKDAFDVILGRIRCPYARAHKIRIATSPPRTPNWFYELFGDPHKKNPDYEVIHATSLENLSLPDFYAKRLKADYDDDTYRREVLGQWVFTGEGRVYTEFDFDKHVRPWTFVPQLDVHIGCDFNRSPLCWVITQVEDDILHQFDELIIEKDATTFDACNIIKATFPESNIYVYPDASCSHIRTSAATSAQSDLQMLVDAGFYPVMPGFKNPPVVDRIETVQTRFRAGKYLIDSKCKATISSLLNTSYQPGSRKPIKSKHAGYIGEHPTDAIGYLCYAYDAYSGITPLRWM